MKEKTTTRKMPREEGLRIVDTLQSSGWVSYLDIGLVVNEHSLKKGYVHGDPPIEAFDPATCSRKKLYSDVKGHFGYDSAIKGWYRALAEIWTSKEYGKPSSSYLLIRDSVTIARTPDRSKNEISLDEAKERHIIISEESAFYLENCASTIHVFHYKQGINSILEYKGDFDKQNKRAQNNRRKEITKDAKHDLTVFKTGRLHKPSASGIWPRLKERENLRLEIDVNAKETKDAIKERVQMIENLIGDQPGGWIEQVTDLYLHIIADGKGVVDIEDIYLDFGKFLYLTGNTAEAESYLCQAEDIFRDKILSEKGIDKTEFADVLYYLSSIHLDEARLKQAEGEASEALELIREGALETDCENLAVGLLWRLGDIHCQQRKLDLVEQEYYEAACLCLRIYDREQDDSYLSPIETMQGLVNYYRITKQPKEAMKAAERELSYIVGLANDSAENQLLLAGCYSDYASALKTNNELDRAESFLKKSKTLLEQTLYDQDTISSMLAWVYFALGELFYEKMALNEAEENLLKAERIERKILLGNPSFSPAFMTRVLGLQAKLANTRHDHVHAIAKWEEALTLIDDLVVCTDSSRIKIGNISFDLERGERGWPTIRAGEYNYSLGSVYRTLGDTTNALHYLLCAESAFRSMYDDKVRPKMFEDTFSLTLLHLGLLYDSLEEKRGEAGKMFSESYAVADWFLSNAHCLDRSFMVEICFHYGDYLSRCKKKEEAMDKWRQALKVAEHGTVSSMADALLADIRNRLHEEKVSAVHLEGSSSTESFQVRSNAPQDDVRTKIITTLESVQRLHNTSSNYREECRSLYEDALVDIPILDDAQLVASFIASYCKFLSDGYELQPIQKLAPKALDYYVSILSKDSDDWETGIKYTNLLSSYLLSLREYNCKSELAKAAFEAFSILLSIRIDYDNDDSCTFAAQRDDLFYRFMLKHPSEEDSIFNVLMGPSEQVSVDDDLLGLSLEDEFDDIAFEDLSEDEFDDFLDDYPTETEPEEVCSTFIPSEDECRIATRILDCYRHVLQPKRHTLVRYLVIAADAALNQQELKKASCYIREAEGLMQGCDMCNPEDLLSFGDVYKMKGILIFAQTPDDSDGGSTNVSRNESKAAFMNAWRALEIGINHNPVMFKFRLFSLLRYIARLWWADIMTREEMLGVIRRLYSLIDDLCQADPFIFTWRSVDAKLVIEDAIRNYGFSASELSGDASCDGSDNELGESLSRYSQMISMISIYQNKDPELYSFYSSRIKKTVNEFISGDTDANGNSHTK